MQSLATKLQNSRTQAQLITFLDFAVVSAGGLERLLKDWHAEFRRSVEAKRRGPRLLRFYEAIVRAASICDQTRSTTAAPAADDPGQVRQFVARMLQEHPHLVAQMAQEAGWTVVLPQVQKSPS